MLWCDSIIWKILNRPYLINLHETRPNTLNLRYNDPLCTGFFPLKLLLYVSLYLTINGTLLLLHCCLNQQSLTRYQVGILKVITYLLPLRPDNEHLFGFGNPGEEKTALRVHEPCAGWMPSFVREHRLTLHIPMIRGWIQVVVVLDFKGFDTLWGV